MQLLSNNEALAQIEHFYRVYGSESYEEKCTQLQHAEQSGTLAIEQGLGEEVALAAFLHDIGHFIAAENKLPGNNAYGYAAHDQLGADFLQQCGFSEKVVYLVREHVQVKRYLVAAKAGYLESLSHASTMTLAQQGGPMTEQEALVYGEHPHLKDIIQLRNIDDSGKQPEMQCLNLDYWLKLAQETLSKNAMA